MPIKRVRANDSFSVIVALIRKNESNPSNIKEVYVSPDGYRTVEYYVPEDFFPLKLKF